MRTIQNSAPSGIDPDQPFRDPSDMRDVAKELSIGRRSSTQCALIWINATPPLGLYKVLLSN